MVAVKEEPVLVACWNSAVLVSCRRDPSPIRVLQKTTKDAQKYPVVGSAIHEIISGYNSFQKPRWAVVESFPRPREPKQNWRKVNRTEDSEE